MAGTVYAQSGDSESEGAKRAASAFASAQAGAAPAVRAAGDKEDAGVESSQVHSGQGAVSPDHWLVDLRATEADLKRREGARERRKLELETLRDDADSRLAELKKLRTELQEYLKKAELKRKKRIAQLVLVLNSTKPTQAARIFESLKRDAAVEILSKMDAKKAAKVVDQLKPEVMIGIIEERNRVRQPEVSRAR